MASLPVRPEAYSNPAERRRHPRRRLEHLAYVKFSPDSGGVLLDVSEGGLRCQIVGAVIEGEVCHVKFALPGSPAPLEADGQVVWSNRTKQGGGVRLLNLDDQVRVQLQQWIGNERSSAPPASVVQISAPTPATARAVPKPEAEAESKTKKAATQKTAASPKLVVASKPKTDSSSTNPLPLIAVDSRYWQPIWLALLAAAAMVGAAALALGR